MWMWNNFFILQTHLLSSSCNCQKVSMYMCVCVYVCVSICVLKVTFKRQAKSCLSWLSVWFYFSADPATFYSSTENFCYILLEFKIHADAINFMSWCDKRKLQQSCLPRSNYCCCCCCCFLSCSLKCAWCRAVHNLCSLSANAMLTHIGNWLHLQ